MEYLLHQVCKEEEKSSKKLCGPVKRRVDAFPLMECLRVFAMVRKFQRSSLFLSYCRFGQTGARSPWTNVAEQQILLHCCNAKFSLILMADPDPHSVPLLPSSKTHTPNHIFSLSLSLSTSCSHIGVVTTKGSENVRIVNVNSIPAVTALKFSDQPWRGVFLQGLLR